MAARSAFSRRPLDERLDVLRSVWAPGRTTREMSQALLVDHRVDLSREAVLHYFHKYRDRLAGCPLTSNGSVGRSVKRRLRPAPPIQTSHGYDDTGLNLKLEDLPARGCKWPTNEGGPFLFCGHERESGTPYCRHHNDRAVGAGTRSERSGKSDARRAAA